MINVSCTVYYSLDKTLAHFYSLIKKRKKNLISGLKSWMYQIKGITTKLMWGHIHILLMLRWNVCPSQSPTCTVIGPFVRSWLDEGNEERTHYPLEYLWEEWMCSFVHSMLGSLKLLAVVRSYSFMKDPWIVAWRSVSSKKCMFPFCIHQAANLWSIRKGILEERTHLTLLSLAPSVVGISHRVTLVSGRRTKRLVDIVR